ncbi:YSC84-related protein [Oceanidesulfovibrio marinus]|uniref:Twin-arginine translocation pathway signal protein n=2 Tax=Oceanidesulfovibrio marinus TaxID=370038 RepID=A0A6P1ZM01_9BACT|nr:YSC84-related protein [Oceanidesulfovibrio marinus]TVM36540.1 twin-arginine translocation pathway signal protein [Oceanidesulfovibrio marinus]
MERKFLRIGAMVVLSLCTFLSMYGIAAAKTAAEIDRETQRALNILFAQSPAAKAMKDKAKGILVFPEVVKGAFIVGGQGGEGELLANGKVQGYYNTIQLSVGLQAGAQKYGYALFFMTDEALQWLYDTDGWEVGSGPNVVVIDQGAAASATTTSLHSDIYAFFFDMKGLMAGIDLQGTKITRVEK